MRKIFGFTLITLSLFILMFIAYNNSQYAQTTRSFSPYTLLASSWEKYKTQFINKDGRVLDHSLGGITTSEGQSYAMLRAVWIDDRETFDLVWKWTKQTMKRPGDNLFGWKWGKQKNGSYGFLENGGQNSASDADSDIALALVFAGRRWNNEGYLNDAKRILADLWKIETAVAGGKRYLIAGNWAKNSEELVVNPSYFAPYAWRIFAKVDKKNDWSSLISPAYELLLESSNEKLDKSSSIGLPPDWIAVKISNGEIKAPQVTGLTTNYSFDAMRVPWRIAVDYGWNRNKEAKQYLTTAFKKLEEIYQAEGKLAGGYAHDGSVLSRDENPIMYSTVLGVFLTTNSKLAKQMYESKIVKLYSNDTNSFNKKLYYYEQNWLWFGAALYNKRIIPL